MELYEIAIANREKQFKKDLKRNKRALKKCIRENVRKGKTRFFYDDIYSSGVKVEREIYASLIDGISKHKKYKNIRAHLNWHGYESSHLRLLLEIIEIN